MSDPQPPYASQPHHGSEPQQPAGYPASNGYPQPTYSAPAPPPGTLGCTAFIIALVGVAVGMVFTVITPMIIASMNDHSGYHVLYIVRSVIGVVFGSLALVLGIVAARRGAQPVLAGIAIGLGAAELIGLVFSFSSSLLMGMLL